MKEPTLLNLLQLYRHLAGELEVTYYLQDSDKINELDAEIESMERALGLAWTPSGPVLKEDS